MNRLFFFFVLLHLSGATQIQPIIDNGYYSIQDWGGTIHPSGKFYVKADRSIVCARDVNTDALIQTYHSPCIAQNIYITPNGNYLVIETIGEIDEWCNRTLIFEFYTGKLVYESRGSAVMNLADGDFIFVYEKVQAKDQSGEYYLYNKVQLGDSVYFSSKAPNVQFDSITVITGKKNTRYEINKWVDKSYFTNSGFLSDTLRGINFELDPLDIKKNLNDFSFTYLVRGDMNGADYNSWSVAVNDTIFIKSDNDVLVYSFALNKEIGIIDSVKIFNANYDKKSKALYLRNSYERKLSRLDLKTLRKSNNRYLPYANHYKVLNDSILSRTEIETGKISYGTYNYKKGEGSWTSNSFRHKIPYEEFFDQDKFTSSMSIRSNAILHNYDFIIDTDRKLIKRVKYFIDTTLVHPGVIGFSPDSAGMLMINEFLWDINSVSQLSICEKKNLGYFNMFDSTGYMSVKNVNDKYHYMQNLSMYNYKRISYPISSRNLFQRDEVLPVYSLEYAQLNDMVDGDDYFLVKNNRVHLIYNDSLLMSVPVVSSSEFSRTEKKYDVYLTKHLNAENILKLNHLPEYTLYSILSGSEFGNHEFTPELNKRKLTKQLWYFGHYNTNKLFDQNKQKGNTVAAINAFTRNLFTTKITYANKFGLPFFQVSILNTEELPELGYAGIIPKNDVYFNTLYIPSPHGRIIGLNYAHGTVQLRNMQNELISESSFYKGGEFIHVLPNGYYFASKGKLSRLSVRVDTLVYPIEQFDIKYNRPDLVLKAMGCTNVDLMELYHNAYLKRLKKLGFTEQMLKSDYHLPEIEIENINQIPLSIDSGKVHLNLKMEDTKFKLDRIQVFINDVPVFGSNGLDIRNDDSQKITKKIILEIGNGDNKIQVSVLNQAGAESYRESVIVYNGNSTNTKPDLYLVTIGDSKYKDSRFDLTYAAKDANDIQEVFATSSIYNHINKFNFTNENVTRENVLSLKNSLGKAKRDDVVIISVAGHGVLDENLNYYLATFNMDFNHPSANGIPYEELESLVDGIPSLKKIILLDACHSGEVDKDEVEQLAVATESNSDIKFRAAGAGIRKKNVGLQTTSEFMRELFSDLRKGTGATVISSAGGAEYAMESDQWKNGLFTYCLLHGLKDNAADANKDGQIMLSELQNYLRTEVTKLSNGAQQPTSRIENISMDFRIW